MTQAADLGIVKRLDTMPTLAGGTQRFVIEVTNHGPSDATGVMVSDPLPAGTTFVSAAPTQGTCTGTTTVTCNLGNLAADGIADVNITVQLDPALAAGSPFSNTATVSGATPDPNPANNTSTADDPIVTSADISLVKSTPASFTAGANGTNTLQVHNAGPSVAAGPLTITDPLPAGTSFVSASGAGWTCQPTPPQMVEYPTTPPSPTGSSITCTNPQSLPVGANAPTLGVTVLVSAAATGNLINTATVTSQTEDPNQANNTSTTPPIPVVALVAEVTSSMPPPEEAASPSAAAPSSAGNLPVTGQPILLSLVVGLVLITVGMPGGASGAREHQGRGDSVRSQSDGRQCSKTRDLIRACPSWWPIIGLSAVFSPKLPFPVCGSRLEPPGRPTARVDGAHRSTLEELTDWTLWDDQVLSS